MTQTHHRRAAWILAVLVLAGCFGGQGRQNKPPVSGLWVGLDELPFLEPRTISPQHDGFFPRGLR